MSNSIKMVLSSALIACAASAGAATFDNLGDFNAATTTTLEDFESFAGPLNTFSETESLPGFDASESGGLNLIGVTNGFGSFAVTSGSNSLAFDDNNGSSAAFTNFGSALTAFGFNITTSTTSTVSIVAGAFSDTINLVAGLPSFFGFTTDTSFSSITLAASGGPNVGFDDVRFGSANATPAPVPLPASGLLLLGTLGGMSFIRRRKKS